MTTTNVFIGFDPEEKTSSKVLQPPGGGGHDIFGGAAPSEAAPPAAEQPRRKDKPIPVLKAVENPPVQTSSTRNKSSVFEFDAPQSNQNAAKKGYNPITGENGSEAASAASQASCIRVRNPPGGPSTALW